MTVDFWADGSPVPVSEPDIPEHLVAPECFHNNIIFEKADPEVNIAGGVYCEDCKQDVTAWYEAAFDPPEYQYDPELTP